MNTNQHIPFWVKPLIFMTSGGKNFKYVQWFGGILQLLIIIILIGINSDYWVVAITIDLILSLWFTAAKRWIEKNKYQNPL